MANESQPPKGKRGPSGTPPTPNKTPNGKPSGEPQTKPTSSKSLKSDKGKGKIDLTSFFNQLQKFQPKYRFETKVILYERTFGAPIDFSKLESKLTHDWRGISRDLQILEMPNH